MSIRKTFQPQPAKAPLRTGAKEKKALEHLGKAAVAGEAEGKTKAKEAAKPKNTGAAKKLEGARESAPEEADQFCSDQDPVASWRGSQRGSQQSLQLDAPDSHRSSQTGLSNSGQGTLVSARLQATSKNSLEKVTLDRDVHVEFPEDFQLLLGVGRITGNLEIAESSATSDDLALLRDLVRVDGKVSLEGNAQIKNLDGLGALEQVGKGVYIAFNDALESASLPKLKRVKGPLIIEANAALSTLALPALQFVSGYLHVHENANLKDVRAPKLLEVEREVSFLDNPKLERVVFDAMPESSGEVEVARSGAAQRLSAEP